MSNIVDRERELGEGAAPEGARVDQDERRPGLDDSATLLQAFLGSTAGESAVLQDVVCFETVALPVVNRHWGLEQLDYAAYWREVHGHSASEEEQARRNERVEQALQQITGALGPKTLEAATSFLLHPQLWQPFYTRRGHSADGVRAEGQAQLLRQLAQAFVERVPPPDWPSRVSRRIVTLCAAAQPGHMPDLGQCAGWLLESEERELGTRGGEPATAAIGLILNAVTAGDWEQAWRGIVELAGPENVPPPSLQASWPGNSRRPILNGWQQLGMGERLRQLWTQSGQQHTLRLVGRLYRQERLNSGTFRAVLEAHPYALNTLNYALSNRGHWAAPGGPGLRGALVDLVDTAIWEMLRDFRPESWPTLCQVGVLRGGHALLRLVEEVERLGLTRLSAQRYGQQQAANTLGYLCSILERRPDDSGASLSSLLGYVSAPALLAVLPLATSYDGELCDALGWQGARELVALLRRLAADDPERSTNPASGVVRRAEVLEIVGQLVEDEARMLLDAFAPHHPGATMLIRAALGWNRKEVRQAFGRRSQLAARALALLPLEGADGLLERYLLLRKYLKEAGSSGAGRKAYERAAAQAALTNLALQAGYPDATRLEWAMEGRIGAERASLGRSWTIEGYTLTLALRDDAPAVEIRRGDKLLKRTPKAVSRDYDYREVSATLEQARDQERRYRQALLDAMCMGSAISQEELQLLGANPLAAGMLGRLVLLDESGAIGLLRAEDCSLEGLYGERVRFSGALTIAHPLHLAQAAVLEDWQAEIVRRQIVQPFKQVFRELYLLTPAEQLAGYSSGRLAGRRMKSRTARAVLANLGWVLDDGGEVVKPFYQLGFAAHFAAGEAWHEGQQGHATTGELCFWPLVRRSMSHGEEQRVPLERIPPLVFSEVMRDLDMVTAIAHGSEELGTSHEVLQRRADLVRALVAALGLQSVEVQGSAIFVQGALARYRLHLATAAIYLESGQYLCIVPERKGQQPLYLPFAEAGEPIVGEIVSKVLMLANDAAIDDVTILAQIRPTRRAA